MSNLRRQKSAIVRRFHAAVLMVSMAAPAAAQVGTAAVQAPSAAPQSAPAPNAALTTGVELPPEYVIGPGDVLGIVFWRDTDMTGDVTVRPDGRITLPLIGDMTALNLTPEALKAQIVKASGKLMLDEPSVTVVVRTINSRKVFITGEVRTPGAYPLTGPLTVLQVISLAGGLTEYADKKSITISRIENGQPRSFKFNYSDVSKGKNLAQNIVLKPGDQILVP